MSAKYRAQFASIAPATPEGCRALIAHPGFSHARRGDGVWQGKVWIYHSLPDSPSGVVVVGAAPEAVFQSVAEPLDLALPPVVETGGRGCC
jgi:hypothetical protein